MRTLLIIAFILCVTSSFAQTQAEMNQQAFASYQKVDKELNDVYKKLLTEYKSDAAFITNLKASQRIWISFRDAELKMKYPDREAGYYGSIHPVCQASYLEELTSERISQLRKWLVGVEGVDGCAGSIKTN